MIDSCALGLGIEAFDEAALSLYLRHRAMEERELAKRAACDDSRIAHEKLAMLYQRRLIAEEAAA